MNRMMKLLLTLSIALIAVAASAQPRGHERGSSRGKEISVEKRAEAMSRKMDKQLELSDEQQKKIYDYLVESLKKHDQKEKKESKQMRDEMIAGRQAFGAEMEKILTKEQFAKWEQMYKERKEQGRKYNEIKQQRGE